MLQPVQRSNVTLTHSTLTICQTNQAHSVACGIVAAQVMSGRNRPSKRTQWLRTMSNRLQLRLLRTFGAGCWKITMGKGVLEANPGLRAHTFAV
jgi:hypothetical protein